MGSSLNKVFSKPRNSNTIVVGRATNGGGQPYIMPEIARLTGMDNDIIILKTMMSDKTLSDEKLKAIQSGMDALTVKRNALAARLRAHFE